MEDESPDPFGPPQEQKKHKGFFATHEKPQEGISPISQELENTVNRLRVLEERYTNLQTEVRITEENMLSKNKRLSTDTKTLMSDINELRREINEIKDRILMIAKELQTGAKKADVDVLRKYTEMWEPMNFVTRKEVNEIIEEKLREKG